MMDVEIQINIIQLDIENNKEVIKALDALLMKHLMCIELDIIYNDREWYW